jgi:hypothetical protein
MLHLKGTGCLGHFLHQEDKRYIFLVTHTTFVPAEKYLPSFGNVVSLDLAISSVAKMAATDIQTELKAMYRPGHFLYAFEYEKGQP